MAKKRVPVKIIKKGDPALLEWREEVNPSENNADEKVFVSHRGFLPKGVIAFSQNVKNEGEVDAELLQAAIPYGDDLESIIGEIILPTPSDIAQAFRRAGIWTFDDLLADKGKTRAILSSLNPIRYHSLITNARRQ